MLNTGILSPAGCLHRSTVDSPVDCWSAGDLYKCLYTGMVMSNQAKSIGRDTDDFTDEYIWTASYPVIMVSV